MPLSNRTLSMILAGGSGSRLAPLTQHRAKPAVPFAGQFRIIDFTLSNCLNSGLRNIYVLTQYKSDSLHRHLRNAWDVFCGALGEHITAVPPQWRAGESWYLGTADAVRQNMHLVERHDCDYVLILSGDHVYQMDYSGMLDFHVRQNSDVTIACLPVPLQDARSFGVLTTDADHRVRKFSEKPDRPCALWNNPDYALASMGIYVFSRDVLMEVLHDEAASTAGAHDFGYDILPKLIETHRVSGYQFGSTRSACPENYWRDVGTIDGYYRASMDVLGDCPLLDLYDESWPVRTHCEVSVPAQIERDAFGMEGLVSASLLGNGVRISGGTVRNSILSPRVRVSSGAVVEDSVLFDGVEVAEGCRLRKCIIDKNVRIPAGECIGLDRDADAQRFCVSDDGVVVVTAEDLKRPATRMLSGRRSQQQLSVR